MAVLPTDYTDSLTPTGATTELPATTSRGINAINTQINTNTSAITNMSQDEVPETVTSWSASTVTLAITSSYYEYTGSSLSTATLPPVSGNTGRRLTVNNRGSAVVNITRAGADSIYSTTSGAITVYALTIGASVDLINDGSYWVIQSETAPWVTKWATRNPGSHAAPSAFTSYYDKPDTAFASLPTTLDTGQAVSYTGVAQYAITSGGLTIPRAAGNTSAYAIQDAGSGNTIARMGAKVKFGTGSTSGGVFTLSITNQPFDGTNNTAFRMSMHLIIGYNSWDYQTVSQATGSLVFTSRGSGSLLNNMDTGIEYPIEVWINSNNTATILLPDGQRVVTSANAEIVPYRYGYFQSVMGDSATDYFPAWTEVWYGTGTQYAPASWGLATREDLQAERSAVATLTGKTLTTPKIDWVNDTNSFPILLFSTNASAANYMGVTNRAAGSPPYFQAFGADTNVGFSFIVKGNEVVRGGDGTMPLAAMAMIRQDATYTLTSSTAVQKLFNASANGRVTLGLGVYRFNCLFQLTGMSTTSGNAGFSIVNGTAVTAGFLMINSGIDAATATLTALSGAGSVTSALPTPMVTASTAAVMTNYVTGTFEVTTAGTIIPSIALQTASAAVVGIGSFFECWQVSPSTAMATAGPWS